MINTILKLLIENNSSTGYGFLIACGIVALIFFILYGINNKTSLSPVSFVIGGVLLAFFTYQMSKLYGAIVVYSSIDDLVGLAEDSINSVANSFISGNDLETSIMSFLGNAVSEYTTPVLTWTQDMIDSVYESLYWYMGRRVIYSVLAIILAVVAVLYTSDLNLGRQSRYTSSRRDNFVSRRSTERRPVGRRTRRY